MSEFMALTMFCLPYQELFTSEKNVLRPRQNTKRADWCTTEKQENLSCNRDLAYLKVARYHGQNSQFMEKKKAQIITPIKNLCILQQFLTHLLITG